MREGYKIRNGYKTKIDENYKIMDVFLDELIEIYCLKKKMLWKEDFSTEDMAALNLEIDFYKNEITNHLDAIVILEEKLHR